MAKAPVGALVGLYVDIRSRIVTGDAIQTTTGRRYLVVGVREQARGKHKGRQHLRCLVGDGTEAVAGKTYVIFWYRRAKKVRSI